MEIVFVYQRLRKEFGRAPKFTDFPSDVLAETMPNPDMLAEYVEQNPTDVAIQCIPEYSEHEVNTERFELLSQGVIHLEGLSSSRRTGFCRCRSTGSCERRLTACAT
jgi:dynein intermediate chain 2